MTGFNYFEAVDMLQHEVELLDQHKMDLNKKEVDDIADEICRDMEEIFDKTKMGVDSDEIAIEVISYIRHLNHLILKDD